MKPRRMPGRARHGRDTRHQGACRGRPVRPPAAPDTPDRSVLAFESDARERGLQQPRVPIVGLDHERHCHAAEHGELVDDRPCWGRLSWVGLGRHADVIVQRGCHGSDRGFRGFSSRRSRPRRNVVQDDRKQMILTVSRRACRAAAGASAALDLEAVPQRALACRAAGLANLLVMCAAGAGRLFLGVAGAAVPDTLSERHAGSFHRGVANSAWRTASAMPASRVRSVATLPHRGRSGRERRCRLFP